MTKVIGLTGGIGCGKTVVAKILSQKGATVLDADILGKTIVEENPEILKSIRETFGSSFFDPQGRLKRKELGNFVFADDGQRINLNAIVHPHLVSEIQNFIKIHRSKPGLAVIDAALIFETGLDRNLDGVLVVSSELDIRLKRIMQRDGLSREDVMNRIKSQMPLSEKISRAAWVIENNGTIQQLEALIEKTGLYKYIA